MKRNLMFALMALAFVSCDQGGTNDPAEIESTEEAMQLPIDTVLKNELETIRVKDQALRLLLPEVNKKFGRDSPEYTYFWELINEQDSVNELSTINIIGQHGWLGSNRVGYNANQAIWLVFQHAPLETQEKYLPLLRESVLKGESEGWCLAFLEDRILMYKGEDQTYGSQARFNNESGMNHIFPIRDVETVNERREKIGLKPIEEYCEENDYIFDQGIN